MVALSVFVLPVSSAFGEGSATVNLGPESAVRDGLAVANPGGGLRTTLDVYAQAGEKIQLGNSLVGLGEADILVFAPGADPTTSTPILDCGVAQPGAGLIESRAQELAGPQPNVGGYEPCELPVTADGTYTVVMVGASTENGSPGTVAEPNTTITQGRTASMWDVTVRNAAGAVQPGRVFSFSPQFRTGVEEANDFQAYVYTRTGYEYRVRFYEQAGVNWILAPDDLGVIDTKTGERLFASFAYGEESNPDINRPQVYFEAELAPASRSYPVFFDAVDPIVISGPGGLAETSGYATSPISPASNPLASSFTGSEGQGGQTNYAKGGTVKISSPAQMAGLGYDLTIDTNGDGTFGDGSDVTAKGELTSTGSTYAWNGRDAAGTLVPCGTYPYQVRSTLSEVHFAMNDVENSGGTEIERISLPTDSQLGNPRAASYNNIDPLQGFRRHQRLAGGGQGRPERSRLQRLE
ncbi:MAG TPA: hypothetical protein VHC18_15490 [Amycolatopsis sp.]|nr:hypothetical protein [Amycolatopsis sp.]